jgi:hypothetical protein
MYSIEPGKKSPCLIYITIEVHPTQRTRTRAHTQKLMKTFGRLERVPSESTTASNCIRWG